MDRRARPLAIGLDPVQRMRLFFKMPDGLRAYITPWRTELLAGLASAEADVLLVCPYIKSDRPQHSWGAATRGSGSHAFALPGTRIPDGFVRPGGALLAVGS